MWKCPYKFPIRPRTCSASKSPEWVPVVYEIIFEAVSQILACAKPKKEEGISFDMACTRGKRVHLPHYKLFPTAEHGVRGNYNPTLIALEKVRRWVMLGTCQSNTRSIIHKYRLQATLFSLFWYHASVGRPSWSLVGSEKGWGKEWLPAWYHQHGQGIRESSGLYFASATKRERLILPWL